MLLLSSKWVHHFACHSRAAHWILTFPIHIWLRDLVLVASRSGEQLTTYCSNINVPHSSVSLHSMTRRTKSSKLIIIFLQASVQYLHIIYDNSINSSEIDVAHFQFRKGLKSAGKVADCRTQSNRPTCMVISAKFVQFFDI